MSARRERQHFIEETQEKKEQHRFFLSEFVLPHFFLWLKNTLYWANLNYVSNENIFHISFKIRWRRVGGIS